MMWVGLGISGLGCGAWAAYSRSRGRMLSPSSPYPLPILSIAPLIGDKRCYGEVTARIRGVPGENLYAAFARFISRAMVGLNEKSRGCVSGVGSCPGFGRGFSH